MTVTHTSRVAVPSRLPRGIGSVVIAGALLLTAACSSAVPENSVTGVSETASAPNPIQTTAVGPGTGSSLFAGADPEVRVTFTLPEGWEVNDVFVAKSDTDPEVFLAFYDVANVYSDGCRWELVDPPPGPTVDDLVAAFARVPGFSEPVRDVTVDGFRGKLIQYTVPHYKESDCRERKYGTFQEDNHIGEDPSLWAQTPQQQNQIRVFDMDGTRLVILMGYPPATSAEDRAVLESIVDSVRIG